MSEQIRLKMRLLDELYVLYQCTELELNKLKNARNDIELENIAHSLIMKYL